MLLHWPMMWSGLYNGISPIVVYNSPLGSPFCKHSSFTCCTTSDFNQRGLLHRIIPNLNITQWLNLGDILYLFQDEWLPAGSRASSTADPTFLWLVVQCLAWLDQLLALQVVVFRWIPRIPCRFCWKAANQGRMLAMIQRDALRGVEIRSNFESPWNSTTRTLQTSVFSLFQIYINRYTDIPVITSVFSSLYQYIDCVDTRHSTGETPDEPTLSESSGREESERRVIKNLPKQCDPPVIIYYTVPKKPFISS